MPADETKPGSRPGSAKSGSRPVSAKSGTFNFALKTLSYCNLNAKEYHK